MTDRQKRALNDGKWDGGKGLGGGNRQERARYGGKGPRWMADFA